MVDCMPKEMEEFIENLTDYIDSSTNYGKDESRKFAFRVWQNKEYLKKILEDTN